MTIDILNASKLMDDSEREHNKIQANILDELLQYIEKNIDDNSKMDIKTLKKIQLKYKQIEKKQRKK